ncbi:MAG TPA: hypothetical protein VHY91_06560 [Pirellulales bacterium]|jgi:hypothetical protein|nr:hypothetical protein [Pirellulales bacterium]
MNHRRVLFVVLALFAALVAPQGARCDEPARTVLRAESFDRDPGWEAHNNRIVPKEYPTIEQNFGYSRTSFASRSPGEMGGLIARAWEPAYYAAKIGPKTLDDKFSASGTFAITKSTPGGGLFFGFFRAEQPGGGGRPIASLGMNMDTEHSGGRLAVRLITGMNQSCGTFITPFIPGKFRPTSLRNDGTRYTWTLDYDPQGADGRGRFSFTLQGDAESFADKTDLSAAAQEEARTHYPATTSFAVDLPAGYKQQPTTFDHFGVMNMMKAGGKIQAYFGDLVIDGRAQDFGQDPNWDAAGNRKTYRATDIGGAQNFGFSDTNNAGGTAGEIGGAFWRTESNWGYYADKVGTLSLNDRLEARGKIKMVVGGPDADMCFGWFHTDGSDTSPKKGGDFLGVKIGGPTRVGHYFLPLFVAAGGDKAAVDKGPILVPAKALDWSLIYDPAVNDGKGAITATLGKEAVTLNLKPGQKSKPFRLDRFGMFSIPPGGQIVRVYLDDIQYTARAAQ